MTSIKHFGVPVDFHTNELRNPAIHQLAADPSTPVNGQMWINTGGSPWLLKIRLNGTTYSYPVSGNISNSDIAAGAAIALSKLATDPLARANHTGTQLASTISNFDTQVRTSRLDQMASPTTAVPFNGQKITGLGLATASTDAASLQNILNTRIDQLTAPTADVAFGGRKITGLADGVAATDAATVGQVNAAANGLDVKQSVRVATTASITKSGTQTIDGVSLVAGDRVLVKNQGDATNGIYVVAAGAWSRSADADSSAEVTPGMFVFVEEGSTQANSGWVLTTDAPITLGTTALIFQQFSKAGDLTFSLPLFNSGGNVAILYDDSTIGLNGLNALEVKNGGITSGKLATGAVSLSSTTVTGTLPIASGGTNATTAAGARTNLGAIGKYSTTITGDASTVDFTVTHNLGNKMVGVTVWKVSTDEEWEAGVHRDSNNAITITLSPAPTAGEAFDVVVMG